MCCTSLAHNASELGLDCAWHSLPLDSDTGAGLRNQSRVVGNVEWTHDGGRYPITSVTEGQGRPSPDQQRSQENVI